MCRTLAHRGPDDCGLWSSAEGKVVFGHRRLSVIDPSPAGHQPMTDQTGHHVLSYNGEIYNYPELARQLGSERVKLRSQCDSEVLLEALCLWGPAALPRLNGMFAFAFLDARAGVIHCARDRFGEKPFLFADGPGFFAFASEYKALLALDGVSGEVDRLRLARFLHQPRQGLDDDRETVFRGVRQLLPGEVLTLDVETLGWSVRRYWDPEPMDEFRRLGAEDAAHRFRELLTDSVRIRMRSDVPQGSCLSGGLDSPAIVCLARAAMGRDAPYHVFTGRFPGTSADEWHYANQVIRDTNATSHVVEPDVDGFLAELPQFVWHNELPVGSASQYAQWCVFRLAAETGITVLLDGQGADELLGGYEQSFQIYLTALREAGESARADREEREIRARYPLSLPSGSARLHHHLPTGLRRLLARLSGRGSDPLFGLERGLAADVAAANRSSADGRFGGRYTGLAAAFHAESFHTHLPTLLRYGDRNSMAHSREVRLPFCDHRLAELVLSLPPGHLMGGAQTKRLLREGLRGILPEAIRTRWNKQGFLPPQEQWFGDRLLDHADAVFAEPSFAQCGLWDAGWWRSAASRLRRGETHLAWVLWRPVFAEAWRTHFIDRLAATPKISIFA